MDILSHALWGATVIRTRPLLYWAFLTGAAPDILGSGPGFLYLLSVRHRMWSVGTWPLLLPWMQDNYHLWHSLVGSAFFFIFLLFFSQRFWILILPYLLHIFMDVLTHRGNGWQRMLFPFKFTAVSTISGINWWESWWVWPLNLGLLVAVNGIIEYRKFKKKMSL